MSLGHVFKYFILSVKYGTLIYSYHLPREFYLSYEVFYYRVVAKAIKVQYFALRLIYYKGNR